MSLRGVFLLLTGVFTVGGDVVVGIAFNTRNTMLCVTIRPGRWRCVLNAFSERNEGSRTNKKSVDGEPG